MSDVLLGGALFVPPVLNYFAQGLSPAFWEDAVVFVETLAVAGGVNSLFKHSVQRPIPRTYEGDPFYLNAAEGYRSFYSGHTTMVASSLSAAAFTVSKRYGHTVWPWVVVGSAGVGVGLGRVLAGYHFYSDVIVGLAAGVAIGTLVPWLHTRTAGQVFAFPIENGLKFYWGTFL